MQSEEFDNFVLVCQIFGRSPHVDAQTLLPELDGQLTALDWYAFDVAAAYRYLAIRSDANQRAIEDAQDNPQGRTRDIADWRMMQDAQPPSGRPRKQQSAITIAGDEVPPWER